MTGEIINHLWQSTVFALLAGLLTLAFRKNRAQVRYWLWLSASVKFLLPFSLLLTLGGLSGPVATDHGQPRRAGDYIHGRGSRGAVSPKPFADAFGTQPRRLDRCRYCQPLGLRTRGNRADSAAGVAAHPGGGAREQSGGNSVSCSGSLFSRSSGARRGGHFPAHVAAPCGHRGASRAKADWSRFWPTSCATCVAATT